MDRPGQRVIDPSASTWPPPPRLMPRLLVPGPIRLSAIADVPVEVWLDGSGLVSRVSETVDGGAAWTVLELHDHGAAVSVPRIDPAHIVDPGEVRLDLRCQYPGDDRANRHDQADKRPVDRKPPVR
jgi:hypothetical protein